MVLFHPKWEIAISNNAGSIDEAAAKSHGAQADTNLAGYTSGIGDYMGNVNSAIAAGNPFKSKDYLTSQNIATSGAMNAANDTARQQQQQTVARTGTNSAALANTIGSQARTGQRDLTNYNATRDTQNENSWLTQQDKLLSDQLAGANSQEQAYATGVGAQSSNLGNMTSAMNASQAAKFGVLDAAMAGAGTGAGLAAGCWIAALLFGSWEDPRTILVRQWVTYDLRETWKGRQIFALYQRFGERVAAYSKTHRWARAILQPIFDRALAAARRKYVRA